MVAVMPIALPKMDVKAALAVFGDTRREIVERLNEATGEAITTKAAEKWVERGTIPMGWWLVMVALAKANGIKFRLEDFLIWSPQ